MTCYRSLQEDRVDPISSNPKLESPIIMNKELIAEVVSELAGLIRPSAQPSEERTNTGEMPFYIVPEPPIPGKTAWSIAPL